MPQPNYPPITDHDPAPDPLRRWRVYFERTGWWGLGVAIVPKNRDVHLAIGPWVLGVEHRVIDPYDNE